MRFYKWLLVFIFFISLATCTAAGSSVSFFSSLDWFGVAKGVFKMIQKVWKVVEMNVNPDGPMTPFLDQTERKVFRRMNAIYKKLEQIDGRTDAVGTQTINTILRTLPDRIKLELRLNDLLDYRTRVGVFYRHMRSYSSTPDIERHTLEDFAFHAVSHDGGSVRSLLERIHAFISPSDKGLTNTGILQLLSYALQVFLQDLNYGLESLESVWIWARAYAELRGIFALYQSFRRFQKLQTAPSRIPSPPQAWLDFAQGVLNTSNSVVEAEDKIAEFVEKENLFKEALKEVEGGMLCNTNQSPQQVLFNLYKSIALTELKGYMMMQFSYMLLKLYNKGNFTKEAQIMRERFEERTSSAISSVKRAMESASREYWKCDPKKHVKNETYIEITNLLQGYIQNEVDLNPEGTCRENCAAYTYTKSHSCYQNLYCRQQRRCNGKIINCQYVDSDMWVCPADSSTGRRYEYVEYENGRVLGRKKGCHKGPVKVDSWWRWLFWHCSYCFCLCDAESVYSDRYINMRSVIADIQNDRVVTGLRFVKNNRIIHLQIQEGKLLPGGEIDVSTVHWVPVENYKITDRNVFSRQDYHTLSWEDRAVDLDDLIADDGYVLTGVRFKKIGSHLNFEIFITPFNFTSGQLLDPINKSFWKDNINTDVSAEKPRRKVPTDNLDVPIHSLLPSIPDSKSDQFLEFTQTDMDRDAAQTTVPFIDAQPVELLVPMPLSGAGIYHKGRPHFGGFIAPKIITYDFSKHLRTGFPEEEEKVN